jgi:acetate kinase
VRVLVVNAGSSSLKLSLIGPGAETLAEHELAAPRAQVERDELRAALRSDALADPDVVAHRIVHGGERFDRAVVVDTEVRHALGELVDLAPLHQPKSLAALDAVSALLPGVPAVACFDTAFHATLPPAARTYALPTRWRERWGVRRYGFHGLSHAWIARRAGELVGEPSTGELVGEPSTSELVGEPSTSELVGEPSTDLRVVSCHLGSGASLCAIRGGRSIDTTMGFTPLEGLVMATRSGSVDPGALLWLMEREHVSEAEVAHALEHKSGLLGLAGTADMREVLRRAEAGDAAAGLALEVYAHRLRAGVAAMAAALDGLDALVFTGGVGERSAEIRAAATDGLGFLGVRVDAQGNRTAAPDAELTAAGSAVRTWVVRAREDLEMAAQARALLS